MEPSANTRGSDSKYCIKSWLKRSSGARPNSAGGHLGPPGCSLVARPQRNWCEGRYHPQERRRAVGAHRCPSGRRGRGARQGTTRRERPPLRVSPPRDCHSRWRPSKMSHGPRTGRRRRAEAKTGTLSPSELLSPRWSSRSCSPRCWGSGSRRTTGSRGWCPGTRGCCCGSGSRRGRRPLRAQLGTLTRGTEFCWPASGSGRVVGGQVWGFSVYTCNKREETHWLVKCDKNYTATCWGFWFYTFLSLF